MGTRVPAFQHLKDNTMFFFVLFFYFLKRGLYFKIHTHYVEVDYYKLKAQF